MLRVFINNVDSAVGHNISRIFSQTAIGSRKDAEPDDDEGSGGEDSEKSNKNDRFHESYFIVGTMSKPGTAAASALAAADASAAGGAGVNAQAAVNADAAGVGGAEAGAASTDGKPIIIQPESYGPGAFQDSGDKKKDMLRREQMEKFAVAGKVPKWVNEVVQTDDREALSQALLTSDIIIYDLVQSLDEASWAIEMLAEFAENFVDKPKTFIALSTVMTWGKTKVDQDDPDAFLAEDEYRRRKPHPNFKGHIAAEKNIIKYGKKSALHTYVIAAGLIYHSGDSIFHYLFKLAWHNEDELVCYGDGSNTLPTIHLDDLCNIVVDVAETLPESKYFLAIDDSKNTLFEITKAISEGLGTGKVKKVPKEIALLNKGLPQTDYDMLLVNLRLEPGHVKDMAFEWKYEAGIIENLPQLIQEYKDARGLTPLKIVLHGPPASGKTYLAKMIAAYYEIHLVEADEVVKEAVARLERRGEGHSEEGDEDLEADRELLEELKEAAKANNNRYPDAHVINFVREKLKSMPCRNQGYILDGYPALADQASQLFKPSSDEEKDDRPAAADDLIIPDHVLSLEAADDFIKERIMNLPESAVEPKNSEEALTRRLEEFRNTNTEENTVLNFFDEIEIHPLILSAETLAADDLLQAVIKHVGKPHNYGPSLEQLAEKKRIAEEQKAKEMAVAEEERQKREKEETERHAKAMSEWNARMEEIRKQEQDVLEAQSVPLRNYLMKYVMPSLTAGLIDVCKVRPEDPIDYLAEFLFKHANQNAPAGLGLRLPGKSLFLEIPIPKVAMPAEKKAPANAQAVSPVTGYLVLYNGISCIGWAFVTARVAMSLGEYNTTFAKYGLAVAFVQSLAILEIFHALFGLVRSSFITTVAQVSSRLILVWLVCAEFPAVANHWLYSSMVIAWGITEVVRYSFYVYTTLQIQNDYFWMLLWCRYHFFYLLYPIGAGSELLLIQHAIPLAKKREDPTLYYFFTGLTWIYPLGFYYLYTHMMKQRKKFVESGVLEEKERLEAAAAAAAAGKED
ncbi:Adenylate kinase 7 [Irineochytrium annulatum]|nr:Adenylate kinase 7 [Irineochytrium annulatum]